MADEDLDISGLSNMTDLATNDGIPLLRDRKTPEDIFNSIRNDLSEVSKKVKTMIQNYAPANSTVTTTEKTVILPEITSTLHHIASIINKLTNNIRDSNELDFTRFKNEAIMSLPITMFEETSACVKAVKTLERLRKESDDYLKLLSEEEELLTEMEATVISIENEKNKSVIQKKAREGYTELKNDLTRVTKTFFKDEESNMYELLAKLVENSQNDADEWYELEDDMMILHVMLLHEAGVLKINPQNTKLVKLIV